MKLLYTADECSDTVFVFTFVLNFFTNIKKALLDDYKHAVVVCVVWYQSHSAKKKNNIITTEKRVVCYHAN